MVGVLNLAECVGLVYEKCARTAERINRYE